MEAHRVVCLAFLVVSEGVGVRSGRAGAAWSAYASFIAFGVFWGFWGAGLPRLQADAGLSAEQLGFGLLFVGVGSLPGMLLAGRLTDWLGVRVAPVLVTILGVVGVATSRWADDMPTVIACLTVVGFAAGAGDVAINTLAGIAEQLTGRGVLTRSHGMFSMGVMLGSLACGQLLGLGLGLDGAFVVGLGVMAALCVWCWVRAGRVRSPDEETAAPRKVRISWAMAWPLLLVGVVAILPYAAENAHQSWSAILMTGLFGASPALASIAPATSAGAAMIARFAIAPWSLVHPRLILGAGGAVSGLGTLIVALAPGPGWALVGFATASVGAATLVPVLLSYLLADVPAAKRGRATSLITTTAYLGFLFGPPMVGAVTQSVGLRGAMLAVMLLMVVFTAAVIPVTTFARGKLADGLWDRGDNVRI